MRRDGVKWVFGVVLLLVLAFSYVSVASAEKTYTYNMVHEVYDWGTGTPKVIVNLEKTIDAGDVSWNTFEVYVRRFDKRLENPLLNEGYRKVIDAYVSDARGNRVDKGQYVTIEMEVHPADSLTSALNYVPASGGNAWVDCEYTIRQIRDIVSDGETITGIVATQLDRTFIPQIDKFTFGSESYHDEDEGDITLTYAAYKPEFTFSEKSPLIIWLHGGGEGGSDPTIPLAANKACHFASKEVQEIFGGAYFLVPQTPTKWMDPSSREAEYNIAYNADGQNSARPYTSKYTKALMHLIEKYVQSNPSIDRNRIYIGGCSNGGFMTIRMLLDYPDYFAAAFPVCEGMTYSYLTDEDIETLKQQNIWFVVAATDATLPGPTYTLPLYDRLVKEGATNVHLSYPKNVVDKSGRYRDENGNPYEYNGHWSWIYVYNNDVTAEINGKEVAILDWMARQRKH